MHQEQIHKFANDVDKTTRAYLVAIQRLFIVCAIAKQPRDLDAYVYYVGVHSVSHALYLLFSSWSCVIHQVNNLAPF